MSDFPRMDLTMLVDNFKRDFVDLTERWHELDIHQKVGAVTVVLALLYVIWGGSLTLAGLIGVGGVVLVVFKVHEPSTAADGADDNGAG